MESPLVKPLALLNDTPIGQVHLDGLELRHWARVVAAVVLGNAGPFTIGIFGEWGTGKTSLLRLSQALVESSEPSKRGDLTIVQFNAWQYGEDQVPLLPLISAIIAELENARTRKERVKQNVSQLAGALRSVLFGISAKVEGRVPLVGDICLGFDSAKAIQRYESLRANWIDQQVERSLCHQAFKILEDVQHAHSDQSRHRVVVFIDDLDRCFPDKAVRLLESIKLILNHAGFVFVLAVDVRSLEGFLNKRYVELGMRDYDQGQSYLAKFIQLPIWIPPHQRRFEMFVRKLLKSAALKEHASEFSRLQEVICRASEYNPRQVVRFLNDILVDRYVYATMYPGRRFPTGLFMIARGVRHLCGSLYRALLYDQALCKALLKIQDEDALFKEVLKKQVLADEDISSMRKGRPGSLASLISSKPGRDWLSNREIRGEVDDFLTEQRRVTSERDAWVTQQVEDAIKLLESADANQVAAGLQVLRAFGGNPLSRVAIPKVEELTRSGKSFVKQQAEVTLNVISRQ